MTGPRQRFARGTRPPGEHQLAPGTLVGNYVIEDTCSSGGFGTLYRARHCLLPRAAAIKVLRYDLSHDPKMLVRFEREARALASLRHPNVVDVYDLGDLPDGRPYIVMQWIDGCNLHEHLDRHGALTLDRALDALAALGSALSAAHEAGVIHRDVKAANVIGLQGGDLRTLKLVDFGIAKLQQATHADGLVTSVGVRMGTPETMAPEQILGREVDERVDVYALGLLFFQLLTGHLPFERSDSIDLEELHLHGVRPNISALVPVPKALDQVLRKALAADPTARYRSVAELVHAAHGAAAQAAPAQGRGVAIRVQVVATHCELDDRTWEEVETIMATARRSCEAAGLAVGLETADMLIAVALLPEQRSAEQALTRLALRSAVALQHELSRLGASARSVVSVHADEIAVAENAADLDAFHGPLLDVLRWHVKPGPRGVLVSASIASCLN